MNLLQKKKNFKPEINPMIANLQDELYQSENKQVKGAKFLGNIRWELGIKKCSKTFFKLLERQNLQNQYLNYILIIIKQNILAILKTLQKKVMKNLHRGDYIS